MGKQGCASVKAQLIRARTIAYLILKRACFCPCLIELEDKAWKARYITRDGTGQESVLICHPIPSPSPEQDG